MCLDKQIHTKNYVCQITSVTCNTVMIKKGFTYRGILKIICLLSGLKMVNATIVEQENMTYYIIIYIIL